MTKTPRLSKTGIEYGDYAWNFYSGCRHKEMGLCPPDIPCWAEELTKRFKERYPNGFGPTFHPEAFLSPLALKKPARILVNFMGDMFGDWEKPYQIVHPENAYRPNKYTSEARNWSLDILIKQIIIDCPQHTFIFLTKNPRGMINWGRFPDNCEAGFTATNPAEFVDRLMQLSQVEARVKWCSLEPLLSWSSSVAYNAFEMLDWVAIGGMTGTKGQVMAAAEKYPELTAYRLGEKGNRYVLAPPVEWVERIIKNCDACGRKVFLKDNLRPLIQDAGMSQANWAAREWVQCKYPILRQEFPAKIASGGGGGS